VWAKQTDLANFASHRMILKPPTAWFQQANKVKKQRKSGATNYQKS